MDDLCNTVMNNAIINYLHGDIVIEFLVTENYVLKGNLVAHSILSLTWLISYMMVENLEYVFML